jgi:hypothetical protein
LSKFLSTELVKKTYAQIIKGLALQEVFDEYSTDPTPRPETVDHDYLSPDSIEVLKRFEDHFSIEIL